MVARLSAQSKAQSKAKLKGLPSAQQAKQNAERLANAEQIICFALLRAENIEKDLQKPPETIGNDENLIF